MMRKTTLNHRHASILKSMYRRFQDFTPQPNGNKCAFLRTATLSTLATGLLFTGCASDHCKELCEDVAFALDQCMIEWDVQWTILEKDRAASFSDDCRNIWYAERSELEGWELEDAEEQCEEAVLSLNEMNVAKCDSLRAIYLASPTY